MVYVIYNNDAKQDVNDAVSVFAKKARRNDHKVIIQNPQGYHAWERIQKASTVVLINGVVGDIGNQIEKDYKADKVKVLHVDAENLESVLSRKQKANTQPADSKPQSAKDGDK